MDPCAATREWAVAVQTALPLARFNCILESRAVCANVAGMAQVTFSLGSFIEGCVCMADWAMALQIKLPLASTGDVRRSCAGLLQAVMCSLHAGA